jgi:hypothetical protein
MPRDRGRRLNDLPRGTADERLLIYLKQCFPEVNILLRRQEEMMRPWMLYAMTWGLTAVGLIALFSMAM